MPRFAFLLAMLLPAAAPAADADLARLFRQYLDEEFALEFTALMNSRR